MITPYLLVSCSVLLNTLAQALIKAGANGLCYAGVMPSIVYCATSPFIVMGGTIYASSLFIWVLALSKLDLNVAVSVASFSYILTVCIGIVIFKETMSLERFMGVLLIVGGIYLVSASG